MLLGTFSGSWSIGRIRASGSEGRRQCSRENGCSEAQDNNAWSAGRGLQLEEVGRSHLKRKTEK